MLGRAMRWALALSVASAAAVLTLALVVPSPPARASGPALASGLKAAPRPGSVVEPVQNRWARLRKKQAARMKARRAGRGRQQVHVPPGHTFKGAIKNPSKLSNEAPGGSGPSGPRHVPSGRTPPGHDPSGHHPPGGRPPQGDDNRPGRGPPPLHWHPPTFIPPPAFYPADVPAEQAEALRSLPRRALQTPPSRLAPQKVERQILVLVDASRPPTLGTTLAQTYGLVLLSSREITLISARAELFRVPLGRSEAAALAALQRDPRVRSAQFNWRYFHSAGPGTALIPQYAPRKVHLPEAHRMALGRNVTIAVIDSAVDSDHPDLEGAVVRSYDVVKDKDTEPDFHGTAIAGIIRSRGVVEGVAPQAGIMAVRAFRSVPGGLPETTTDLLLAAIEWAVSNGAKVLNMSFVGPRNKALQDLLDAAGRKGVVLVAAAGNAGPKAPPAFPAAFPGVIAVTAVDAADKRYQHANRGRYISVAAPGVDVLAPVDGGGHELLSGTSFATAYVSGIAALLLERDPTLDAASIARLIAAGADDLGPAGRDDDFGAGRVNALSALESMREVAARGPGRAAR